MEPTAAAVMVHILTNNPHMPTSYNVKLAIENADNTNDAQAIKSILEDATNPVTHRINRAIEIYNWMTNDDSADWTA